MIRLYALLDRPGIAVVYDGECPFCASYVRLARLRETVGPVALIDARAEPLLVADLKSRGLDLDEGMVVVYGTSIHSGSDALHVLSLLSSRKGWVNRGLAWLFRDPAFAARAYPYMRAGRALALRLLGRKPLGAKAAVARRDRAEVVSK